MPGIADVFHHLGGSECGFENTSGNPGVECTRSEEHTSELQSRGHLVCRLLLEKKKKLARGHPPGRGRGGGPRAPRRPAAARTPAPCACARRPTGSRAHVRGTQAPAAHRLWVCA